MNELTRSEAKEQAKEAVDSIDSLINSSDIEDNAETWEEIEDEKLEMELFEGATMRLSEQQKPFYNIAVDLAYTMWQNDLPRAPMDHLAFDSKEKAVEKGYWPNSMDKWECREILEEMGENSESFLHYYSEAYDIVVSGMVEGMEPEE